MVVTISPVDPIESVVERLGLVVGQRSKFGGFTVVRLPESLRSLTFTDTFGDNES